jgi:hypothetical protein
MFGLNTDPLTDASYTSIDYAWYIRNDGQVAIYEGGVHKGVFSTYVASDILAVIYDGVNVRYTKNGEILRTISAPPNLRLYFDSSFNGTMGKLTNIRFGPLSAVDWGAIGSVVASPFSGTDLASTPTTTIINSGSTNIKDVLADSALAIGSAYTTAASNAAWIQADFGSTKFIESSFQYFYAQDSRTYSYAIAISDDAATWRWIVGDGSAAGAVSAYIQSRGPINNWRPIGARLPTIDRINDFARYVRVFVNGNTVNTGNHWYQWQLWSAGAPNDPYIEDYNANVSPGATVGAPAGTYVGDTLAQTVESNASTALSTANTAATNATTALAALTDIASDSLLTPGEKPSIIAQRDVIVAEQAGIDTQATAYGITTEKTTYDTAISALTTYLATLTSPVLWSTLTGNTTIVGATFRSKFNDVYVARQVVLNKIAANAKALADAAQTQANTATTNAATAQATANTASTNANTANALLTDIASDAKLTPSEKHDVRREWGVVINEKAGINTNAGLYAAAATANTAYNTAVQTLGTYLNNGAAYTLSTSTPPSWINDASLGTTTTIVGATFRSNWQAMYAARQVLLNKIAEEAGKVASWSGVTGTGKPADNATKNTITAATTAPSSPTDGDVWVDTNAPVTIKTRVSGAWVASGNVATSLSQVNSTEATKLSGIATGATVNIVSSGVFASRPAGANGDFYYSTDTKVLYQKVAGAWVQSATVGATFGVDISGQITPANASTYIANAAIQTAQIADAAITSAKIGNAAIGSAQIGNLVVQAAHIENLTVGTGKIADSAITDVVLGTWTTDSGYVSSYNSPTYTLTLSHAASVLITTQIDYAIFMTGGVSSVKLYVDGSLKRSLTFDEYSAQRSFGIAHALNLAAGAHTMFVRVAGGSIENRGGYIYALGVKK